MADNTNSFFESLEASQDFKSTRHEKTQAIEYVMASPRLGRRESEPHSEGVSYLFDVLQSNFPNDRVTWDLHHYFDSPSETEPETEEIDIQFDISYFRHLRIAYALSSFKSKEHQHRIPTMAINILSRSTLGRDVGFNVDTCRLLKIPLYVLFNPYLTQPNQYKAPFLRLYRLTATGDYQVTDLREVTLKEGGELKKEMLLDAGDIVPFKFGIMKREKQFKGGLPLYQLILVHPDTYELYKTTADQEKARADQEKARADQEKARADQEKARAEQTEKKLKGLEEELKKYQKNHLIT